MTSPVARYRALTPTVTVKRASDIIPGYRFLLRNYFTDRPAS